MKIRKCNQFLWIMALILMCGQTTTAQQAQINAGTAATIEAPRLTFEQIMAITSPQNGMMVYDLTFKCLRVYVSGKWKCSYENTNTGALPTFAWKDASGAGDDEGLSITTDPAGNLYVAGYYSATATFGETNSISEGQKDIFLAKYTPTGSLIWFRTAGGAADDTGYSVATDANGNVYLVGAFMGTARFFTTGGGVGATLTSTGGSDAFLAKYSSTGSLIWVHRVMGGTGDNRVEKIRISANGTLYLMGYFRDVSSVYTNGSTVAGSLTPYGEFGDIFFAKYNTNGGIYWYQHIAGQGDKFIGDMVLDDAQNIYMVASNVGATIFYTTGGAVGQTITHFPIFSFFCKYSTDGALTWVRYVWGTSQGTGIALDQAGGVYITGAYNSDIKFLDSGGGFVGDLFASLGATFIVKYNVTGDFQWSRSYKGVSGEFTYSMGNTILCRSHSGTLGLWGGGLKGRYDLGGIFLYDFGIGKGQSFVAELNNSGVAVRAAVSSFMFAPPTFSTSAAKGCVAHPNGSIYATGYFVGNGSFGMPPLTAAGGRDIYVVRSQ